MEVFRKKMKKEFLIFLIIVAVTPVLSHLEEFPICDPSSVTWHSHPFACTMYIICFHGNPIERLCAPSLHFNGQVTKCMHPQLAQCDFSSVCPVEDDPFNPVILPNPKDCSSYFVCFNGSLIQRSCADEMWWDVTYKWCTEAEHVNCDSRTPNNPRPPTDTTEAPTTISPTTTEDPDSVFDCPHTTEPEKFPHSRDCNLYFICVEGISFLQPCAQGMNFDIVTRKCDAREFAKCAPGTE